MIDILDINCGNITTWNNLLNKLNIGFTVVTKEKHLSNNTLIIPGVGSAGHFMNTLLNNNFDKIIYKHLSNGNRIIGICLGFQILNKYTEEDGGVKGLGIISGKVMKFNKMGLNSNNGWLPFEFDKRIIQSNNLTKLKLSKKLILSGRVYYNHEYGVVLDRNNKTINNLIPDTKYSSIYINDNIIGMQFHPEKSQDTGIELLKILL